MLLWTLWRLHVQCIIWDSFKTAATEVVLQLHRIKKHCLSIYSVSELLEKHGLQKPVSFVKDTKDNAEEARKLMIRLTRHTGRKLVFKGR